MAGFFRYTNAIFGTQSRVNSGNFSYRNSPDSNDTWSWTGPLNGFTVREQSDENEDFDGDGSGGDNERILSPNRIGQPDAQTVEIAGTERQIIWDYSFEVRDDDTGIVYTIGVIDVDLDTDNSLNDANEDGYFLVFVGAIPPADKALNSLGITDNRRRIPHEDLGADVVCFAAGTLIQTQHGLSQIERLEPGARVLTHHDGYQPLRWIGRTIVSATGKRAPVVIQQGALGNKRDLVVSRQHRLLIRDWRAQLLFGEDEVLVRACDLVNGDTIFERPGGQIEYVHMLFDHHQIVFAEGIPSESLYVGQTTLNTISPAARREIFDLFPELQASICNYGPMAAHALHHFEGRCLAGLTR